MSHIAKRSAAPVSKTDILAIGARAKADAAKGNKVINASIGTFYDDDKKMGEVPLIKKALSENVPSSLGYPSVYGDPNYLKGVRSFMFGEKEKGIDAIYKIFGGATLGGTGALSIAFNIFLEEGETVLLPSVMWTNYKLIAKKAGLKHDTYQLFNADGRFNLSDVKAKIEESFADRGSAFLLINDPCQNPTGYCLDEKEYEELFLMLNALGKKGKLTVLFDVAYSAFYAIPGHHFALNDELSKGKPSFLPLIAFSCSKLLGVYGLRLGALFALCQDEEEVAGVSGSFGAQARGTYSCPVGPGLIAVSKILNDPSLKDELWAEIKTNTDCLAERSKELLEYADELGIPHYPYKCGFFLTVKANNAFEVHEKLMEQHIYVVPMGEDSIRIALGALNVEEGKALLLAMKQFL
ncbi:MAG: aminotransferase class I/II-fold pyridoxal phosphate-dependent enzyme [Bacilli bacterium]|nr:aminotransferase class I/II-fold pyridoxal phosphate-dependent enzyme [Bacilli bacterium]